MGLAVCNHAHAEYKEWELLHTIYKGQYAQFVDIVSKDRDKVFNRYGARMTLLHHAAIGEDIMSARYLVENNARVNAQDSSGSTPLHYATAHNDKKMVELLITNGAHRGIKNNLGLIPLDYAEDGSFIAFILCTW